MLHLTTPKTTMHNRGMSHQSTSGQILVLVLLVVLVGMSIGLSVASRTLSNLKQTTQINQSNRAFSAAEAGIEVALSKLNVNQAACANNCFTSDDAKPEGVDSVKVTAKTIGNNNNAFGLSSVQRDDVMQVTLNYDQAGPDDTKAYEGQTLGIFWDKKDGVGCSASDSNQAAAIVVSLIYSKSGQYGMAKQAYDPCNVGDRANNGFEHDTTNVIKVGAQYPTVGYITLQDDTQKKDYGYSTTIKFSDMVGGSTSGMTLHLLRIRLMYGDDTEQIAVNPEPDHDLPPQGQEITSTAVANENQRTVKVIRSNATLPAIFDYALFNGSTNSLSK